MTSAQDSQVDELSEGVTLLNGQYLIESNMVRGGFGITYLARDNLDRQYVIKECFPGALVCRANGRVQPVSSDLDEQYASILRHFLKEARRLAKLDHPNIVRVHQVFEENGTAYMALERVDGDDLLGIVEDMPERLTPKTLEKALVDALDAIAYIHSLDILHRDISPDNFLFDGRNHLTLIDFGAAREKAGKESRALSALLAVKDGYSPHEFYLNDVTQNPSSDLYSLGATFYHLITGEAPPNSQDRLAALAADMEDPYLPLADGNWPHDDAFLESIDLSLAVLPQDRIQSAEQWMAMIGAQPEEPALHYSGNLEVDLQGAISRLVEDTNRGLTQGTIGTAAKTDKRRWRRTKPVEQDNTPTQPVDIFGNPIDDVDAWLREQDRQARKQGKVAQVQTAPRKDAAKAGDTSDKKEKPTSRPVLAKLLSACLPTRQDSTSSALNN